MSRSPTGAENEAVAASPGVISCHGHIQGPMKMRQYGPRDCMAGCHIMSRSHIGAEIEALAAWPGPISCPDHLQGLRMRE